MPLLQLLPLFPPSPVPVEEPKQSITVNDHTQAQTEVSSGFHIIELHGQAVNMGIGIFAVITMAGLITCIVRCYRRRLRDSIRKIRREHDADGTFGTPYLRNEVLPYRHIPPADAITVTRALNGDPRAFQLQTPRNFFITERDLNRFSELPASSRNEEEDIKVLDRDIYYDREDVLETTRKADAAFTQRKRRASLV